MDAFLVLLALFLLLVLHDLAAVRFGADSRDLGDPKGGSDDRW